jgi:Rrf2 family protein
MAFIGNGIEYGLHCLLWLAGRDPEPTTVSSCDLAELQGISPSFVAKILTRLEKAGIVAVSEGRRGGYRLARPAERISVLDVVDAVEGEKSLFDCQEVRRRCALFRDGEPPPAWATDGVCSIHAVMLRAEHAMRDELAQTTVADLARTVERKAPGGFSAEVQAWLSARAAHRREPSRENIGRQRRKSHSRPNLRTSPPSKGASR